MHTPLKALLIAATSLLSATSAHATLGETEASIENVRSALGGVQNQVPARPSLRARQIRIHEVRTRSTTVREYALPSGTVFAVSWSGRAHPNLSQVLGSHHPEYARATSTRRRKLGQHRRQVETNQIVVKFWGHMRHLRGQAYIPHLMPAGTRPHDLE